jgi:hypothetical protein
MIINYTIAGTAFPDLLCEETLVNRFKQDPEQTIDTSTANMIDAVRALICLGRIPHDNISFALNGQIIGSPNKNGALNNWPFGFCDCTDKWLDIILTGSH